MPSEETKTPTVSSPNLGKKFVQTRLPFKVLSPGVTNKSDITPKRKLSSPAVEDRACKVLKKAEDEEIEHMEEGEDFSDPDAIIVIHEEDSQEKTGQKDNAEDKKPKSTECVEKIDEEDAKGIRIKFPFVKKDKIEVNKAEPKKSKQKRKRARKGEKKETESITEVHEKEEEPDLPAEVKVIEVPEEAPEDNNQEVEKPAEEQQEAPEEDSSGDKSDEAEKTDIAMICDEKLSRSSDGDNQNTIVETPPRKRAKECETPTSSEVIAKKLTPKQLEKQQDIEKRRQERLADKVNRRKKQEEEKELKKKEREEKEEQKRKEKEDKEEQRRKEKEEKEEQKRKEKEEKEKKRQAELDAKNEEKRQKEEEKRQKEDEKRKKEEEKKEAARRASDNFMKFFKLKSKPSTTISPNESDKENTSDDVKLPDRKFMPFCVKPDMQLAPNTRRNLKEAEKSRLDRFLSGCLDVPDQEDKLYLKELRAEGHCPVKSGKTWLHDDESDDEVILIDDEGQKIEEIKPTIKYRVKFLSFHENQRPPYYGTWRKKSANLGPRNPFAKDEKLFDYEVDSDDEWEEEEPGESLHGSDDEKDKESEDDYEVDNDFFVPHGHLSDEELQNEDEMDNNSPEIQKVKLKLLQQEFADEMKKKTEKLKPRLIGCVWQNASGERPDSCSEIIWRLLLTSKMLFNGPIDIKVDSTVSSTSPNKDEKASQSVKKRKKLHEDDVKNLIRLAHGNCHNGRFLVEEFLATRAKQNEAQEVTKIGLKRKLREVAEWKMCPEDGAMQGKMCWYVTPDVREKYGLQDLTLPNTWKYTLTPKRVEEPPAQVPALPSDDTAEKQPPKKRVALLMSVPRGQAFSPSTKTQLISQFLKKTKPEEKKPPTEVIELD